MKPATVTPIRQKKRQEKAERAARVGDFVHSPENGVRVAKRLGFTLIAGIVVFLFVPWQQNVSGRGAVTAFTPSARVSKIEATINGRVQKWFHVEGDLVEEGAPLVELVDNAENLMEKLQVERVAIESRRDELLEKAKAREAQLDSVKTENIALIAAANAKVEAVREKKSAADSYHDAKVARFEVAEENWKRLNVLFEKGVRSQRDLEVAKASFLVSQTAKAAALADVRAAKADVLVERANVQKVKAAGRAKLDELRAKISSAKTEIASANAKLARLDVGLARQQARIIRAPRRGVLQSVVARNPGEQVSIGEQLAVVVPMVQDRAVEIWVHGNDAPLIQPGAKTRLLFEGWPAVQFVGWPSVAVGSFPGRVAFVDQAGRASGEFRVVVVPEEGAKWPDGRYLRQGVRARAFFLLDRVSLGYELWRQVNGFPIGRVMYPNDELEGGKKQKAKKADDVLKREDDKDGEK